MSDRPKRKQPSDKLKLTVVLAQGGLCKHCGERLGKLEEIDFDHRPAIINREVNAEGTDYIPPQLDPEYLEAIHKVPCHKERTAGPGGEKRITTAGSDIHTRDKTRRLQDKRLEREAAVKKAQDELSDFYDGNSVAPEPNSIKTKPKRKIQSANRWPAKKPKVSYVRRGV
jgi:hypothetical protein